MKKLFKTIASLSMAITLLLGMSLTAFAADSSITYEGGAEKYVFLPGSGYTDTDLFNNFKDVMPGDNLNQEITVKNNSGDCDRVKIYMRAVAHDENGNPLTYSETYENVDGKDQANIAGQRDETVATMQDFLHQLDLQVVNTANSKVIFQGTAEELDGLSENILLGEFKKGDEITLVATLSVPIEMGNEYANRVGEVDWVFVAEEINDPEPEGVKTGDNVNLTLWIGLVGVSALVIISLILIKRKMR